MFTLPMRADSPARSVSSRTEMDLALFSASSSIRRQAQLLFGFSHPAVCAGLFHMGIPLFVGFLTNLFDLYFNTGIAY